MKFDLYSLNIYNHSFYEFFFSRCRRNRPSAFGRSYPKPLLQVDSHYELSDEFEVVEVLTSQTVPPRPHIRQSLGKETHVDVDKDSTLVVNSGVVTRQNGVFGC